MTLFIATIIVFWGLEYKTAFLETYLNGEWRVGEGEVALTFDDCPSEPYTSQILDILKENNVKATFFIIGEHAIKYPDVVNRMITDGHSIGNHGYTDRRPALLGDDNTEEGIISTQNILEDITGERPSLFRLPSGIPRRDIKNVINKENLRIIFADVMVLNEREKESDEIVTHIRKNTNQGSIILLHGDHIGVVKALGDIILELEKYNLKFARLEY
jgi:peptidoglycan/xylan/chitin deacetylase (PgdA/CDA1 family)